MLNYKQNISLIFLATTLLVSSCGNKVKTPVSTSTSLQTTFTKGNPLTIIENTFQNNESFLTTENIHSFDNYTLNSIHQFTEREILIEAEDTGTIETGNEAQTEDTTKDADKLLFKFSNVDNDYSLKSENIDLTFNFKKVLNKIILTDVETATEIFKLKVLHYSVKKSNDAFSILAEADDNQSGKILLSFVFVKKSEQEKISTASDYYKYLFGPGIKIGWNQKETLDISICGAGYELNTIYEKALNIYKFPLYNRLNYNIKKSNYCAPFSDLNTQAIYTVKNYQTEYNQEYMNPGTAYSVANKFKGSMLDSDVIIWVTENEKSGYSIENNPGLPRTISHEFGHLLGLDHQFTKGITSIMSYNRYDNFISNYDTNALSELYPIITK